MSESTQQTIVARGTEIEGSIRSQGLIRVGGTVKGELQAPELTVEASGSVHGQVMVTVLRSEGEVSGEIDADSVELSGRVSDHTVINAHTLEVKLNQANGLQVMFGNCELRVNEGQRRASVKSEVVVEHDARRLERDVETVL